MEQIQASIATLAATVNQLTQDMQRLHVRQAPRLPQPRRGRMMDADEDLDYEEEERHPPRHHDDIKLKIPPFKGSSSPEEFLEWVQRVEKIFECSNYSEMRKCQLAALEFTGYANLWWENIKQQRRRDGEEPVRHWRAMKRLMQKRFVPDYYKQELYLKLQNLRQGGMCVEDYLQEFETLLIRCEFNEPEEQTIARFLGGLKFDIADRVELQPYATFEDVVKLAIRIERQNKRKVSRPMHPKEDAPLSWPKPKMDPPQFLATQASPWPETANGKTVVPGQGPPMPRTREIKCFKCLGVGHIAAQCPNKRVVVLRNEEVESEEEEGEQHESGKEESEEIVVRPDYGELFILRRVLTTHAKEEEEEEQRENLFHTRRRIKDKVCGMVVDNGSCTNVASTRLVEKMGFPTLKHPRPYKLKWLNNDEELLVTKQVEIPFSIGKSYTDKVLCDVVPMDAGEILLGRPWQFDRRAVHDGYLNTYTFAKDGKKITLAPLHPSQVKSDQLKIQQREEQKFGLFMTKKAIKKKNKAFEFAVNKSKKLISFVPIDLVWTYLRKRFQRKEKSELVDEDKPDLRANPSQPGENDEDIKVDSIRSNPYRPNHKTKG